MSTNSRILFYNLISPPEWRFFLAACLLTFNSTTRDADLWWYWLVAADYDRPPASLLDSGGFGLVWTGEGGKKCRENNTSTVYTLTQQQSNRSSKRRDAQFRREGATITSSSVSNLWSASSIIQRTTTPWPKSNLDKMTLQLFLGRHTAERLISCTKIDRHVSSIRNLTNCTAFIAGLDWLRCYQPGRLVISLHSHPQLHRVTCSMMCIVVHRIIRHILLMLADWLTTGSHLIYHMTGVRSFVNDETFS